MNDLELTTAELPEAMRAWLANQPAVVVCIEQIAADRLRAYQLPELDAEVLARLRVTMAKYREALMNLT